MSFIAIHCRLVVGEDIRRQLWNLMAGKNTPLVTELLQQVVQHDNFADWQQNGNLPVEPVRQLCKLLQTDPRFDEQPERFYKSASLMVTYTFKAWLAAQQKCRKRIDGKQRWLNVVKSDVELVQISNSSIEIIRDKAQEILARFSKPNDLEPTLETDKGKKPKEPHDLMGLLFKEYETTEDVLTRCAISHLLKNNCEVNAQEEDSKAFAERINRKQETLKDLEQQLKSRLPKGRDLTGEDFLETLAISSSKVPEDEIELALWQAKLLKKSTSLPYPILFGSQDDLRWTMNEKGRICVTFKGLEQDIPALKTAPFQIYCDQRQIKYFQKFLEDWQAYQLNKNTYPLRLFLLKTSTLGWKEGKGKGHPWNVNQLTLHCILNTDALTFEGTEKLRLEGIKRAEKQLSKVQDSQPLTDNQKTFLKRSQSTLARLQNPPQRPSKPLYQGQSEILVGVSVGLVQPLTAVVINATNGEILAQRSTRELLGNNYRLLNRQRYQQQRNALKQRKNKIKGVKAQPSESELGQYVDRLIAKSVINLAREFRASCIVLPHTNHLRTHLSSEIKARAKQKSDVKEVQRKYAKQFQISVHRWSYSRLLANIRNQATKVGISIEARFPPSEGSPEEKARDLALTVYHTRHASLT